MFKKRSLILYGIVFFLLLVVVGCSYRPIRQPDSRIQKEGVIIGGTFQRYWMLWLTSGISIKIDHGELAEIPWAEGHFITLSAGRHSFEIWYDWLWQRAAIAKGCFVLEQEQVLYLEYKPSGLIPEGEVELIDFAKRNQVPLDNCF